ncbi:MAG: mechanosensitive ion channel [Flavobacteriales bacterium]|nr:mechanosensitive ion channel [Flavobacteriales bacterium]
MAEEHYMKIIETGVIAIAFVVIRTIIFRIINKTMTDRFLHETRGIVMKKVISITLSLIALIFILLIWGVDQTELAVFIGSVLTVVGVAFFAQWSILSNITSSIIIFFNHPIMLNDQIVIMEAKDFEIRGKVTNIGLFFITLEMADGEELSLPNNVFIQKSVRKISKA